MTVLHYLEKTAVEFHDKQSIIDENGSYTFTDLREMALSLASRIDEKLGGKRRQPILVYLPKGKECIAAFLAIAYSGNIYSPTDIKFPFPKVQTMIDVLRPALYISDGKNAQTLRDNGIPCENILLFEETSPAEFDAASSIAKMIDTDPVYVFFTSGSTGVPKGVTITHRNILDYIDWAADRFSISEAEIIGNHAQLYFDNSILDIYLCLKKGATLHVIPERHLMFPIRLLQYVQEHQINFIFWVPTALCQAADQRALEEVDLKCLRKVLFCGEVMPTKQLNYWRKHIPDALYANLYGPTEITDACTYFIVDRQFTDDEPLPIGFPCANTDILLLDETNSLVTTPGQQGELCVRGTSLSVGYWDAPEKTAERFCQNPINTRYHDLIYRTGDLAHYNDRGELMFDGRMDHQIKYMGYRIELGEIEAAAQGCEGVSRAACLFDEAGNKIMLFFTGENTPADITAYLREKLPRYMHPRAIIQLAEMPWTASGKIDRVYLRTKHIEAN